MADIYQPKKSAGLMGSKAFGVGMGIATGNPMMAAGALAGDSPAGKMMSMYNRFNSLSGSNMAPKPEQIQLGESVVDETPMDVSPIDRRIQMLQQVNPIFANSGVRRYA